MKELDLVLLERGCRQEILLPCIAVQTRHGVEPDDERTDLRGGTENRPDPLCHCNRPEGHVLLEIILDACGKESEGLIEVLLRCCFLGQSEHFTHVRLLSFVFFHGYLL